MEDNIFDLSSFAPYTYSRSRSGTSHIDVTYLRLVIDRPKSKNKASLYLSSHILGKAGDFTVKGLTAEDARRRIKNMAHLLPCPIRVESGVHWLHFDVLPQYGIDMKVYEFKA